MNRKLWTGLAILLLVSGVAWAAEAHRMEAAVPELLEVEVESPGEAPEVAPEISPLEDSGLCQIGTPEKTLTGPCEEACNAEYEWCDYMCHQYSANHDELGYCLEECEEEAIWCFGQC